nr:hypothetical protein [Tanacetum cinerariifolium]
DFSFITTSESWRTCIFERIESLLDQYMERQHSYATYWTSGF